MTSQKEISLQLLQDKNRTIASLRADNARLILQYQKYKLRLLLTTGALTAFVAAIATWIAAIALEII